MANSKLKPAPVIILAPPGIPGIEPGTPVDVSFFTPEYARKCFQQISHVIHTAPAPIPEVATEAGFAKLRDEINSGEKFYQEHGYYPWAKKPALAGAVKRAVAGVKTGGSSHGPGKGSKTTPKPLKPPSKGVKRGKSAPRQPVRPPKSGPGAGQDRSKGGR